jgi:hypothetical protein
LPLVTGIIQVVPGLLPLVVTLQAYSTAQSAVFRDTGRGAEEPFNDP